MGETRILKLEPTEQDEVRELEFELDFLKSLSVQERFDMLFETSCLLREMLYRYGHRKPFEIVKRTSSHLTLSTPNTRFGAM